MNINITWFSAASVLIEWKKTAILFDPFFENISFNPLDFKEVFAHLDAIFITHGHFDHIGLRNEIFHPANCPVYVPGMVHKNILKWNSISDKNRVYSPFHFTATDLEISGEDLKKRIRPIKAGDILSLQPDFFVKTHRSSHIHYDAGIFYKKLSKISNWKYLPAAITLILHYPKKTVTGYSIEHKGHKILNFGSLPETIPSSLYQLAPVDLLFIPAAGKRSGHLRLPVKKLITAVKPGIVIPHHHNNFFPPISDETDINPLKEMISNEFPKIDFICPEPGKTFTVLLKGQSG